MASSFPSVSVIVPVYNGESDLPDLITYLQQQTYPSDRLEFFIVDNHSHDRTSEILALHSWVRSLQELDIQSSYAARNLGIRHASGEILVFTDADCRPEPTWLENLVQPFEAPTVGIVAGEIKALPGNTLLEHFADRQNTLSQTHTLSHPFYPYGQTANLAIRAEVLQKVGLFRPHLTTGGDADICWRILSQTAWEIRFAETAIVQHRHRSTLAELRSQWRRYGRSNRYLHELHRVDLMRELSFGESCDRLIRWLFKEVPITTLKTISGRISRQSAIVDLLTTPIGLICAHARCQGQRTAQLPAEATTIEWLPASSPCSSSTEIR
jgi:glycosyltransferase involved in cell wall biosynthesis